MAGIDIKVNDSSIAKEFAQIQKNLEQLARMRVIVRIKPDAAYEDGTKVEDVGVWMEYGSEGFRVHYPARPFWRSAIDAHLSRIKKRFKENANQVARGRMTARACFEDVGELVVAFIKRTLKNGVYAPLADSTIAKREQKGNFSTQPLIDTGLLLESIEFIVEGG